MKRIFCLLVSLLLLFSYNAECKEKFLLGVERLDEPIFQEILTGKRLALFTNQTGVDRYLRSSVDLVKERYQLNAVFVPEHGLFGAIAAGENVSEQEYQKIPVFSLYGATRRPTKAMLENIDAVVVDIQDVGIRHYTYFSSLAYIMEACAKEKKYVIILDRPNPLGGAMQGPVLKKGNESFIGLYPLPLRHGLTIGEFARYINSTQKINCQLEVIPMTGWKRSMLWYDTKLPWVMTSPLIPTVDTAILYGITGVCGDSNLSVGVGTAKPFFFIGAPFVDGQQVKAALDTLNLPGVAFRAVSYIPRYGAYNGELVQGVEIYLLDKQNINAAELQYQIYYTFRKLYSDKIMTPERDYNQSGYKIDIALGESSMRDGDSPEITFLRWKQECAAFAQQVFPYLLYK